MKTSVLPSLENSGHSCERSPRAVSSVVTTTAGVSPLAATLPHRARLVWREVDGVLGRTPRQSVRVRGVGQNGRGAARQADFADLVARMERQPSAIGGKRQVARPFGPGDLVAVPVVKRRT